MALNVVNKPQQVRELNLSSVVFGNRNADIVVICDSPPPSAWNRGSPMTKENMDLFAKAVSGSGLSKEDFCFIAPCPPVPPDMFNSEKQKGAWLEQYKEEFEALLSSLSPKVVVVSGSMAAKQYYGRSVKITTARGLIVENRGLPCLPILSMGHVSRVPDMYPLLVADLKTLGRLKKADYVVSDMSTDDAVTEYKYTLDLSEVIEANPRIIAVDTETTGLKWYSDDAYPFLVQITYKAGHALLVPVSEAYLPDGLNADDIPRAIAQLKQIMEDPSIHKVGHNFKYDIHMLRKLGIEVRGWHHDTMQLAYTIDENMRQYGLDDCVRVWLPSMAGYCLSPEAKVLSDDLTHIQAGDVKVGDYLVGFDENTATPRERKRMRRTKVTAVSRLQKERYTIKTEAGRTITVSADHKWLVKDKRGKDWKWEATSSLSVGRKLHAFPWEQPRTDYLGGYMGGIFDGEGWVGDSGGSASAGMRMGFAQNQGVVLDRAKAILDEDGFTPWVSIQPDKRKSLGMENLVVSTWSALRAMQLYRPERLISKNKWEGKALPTKSSQKHLDAITSIERVGVGEVVSITTEHHTFIAEGLCSHNCDELTRNYDMSRMIDVPHDIMKQYAGGDTDVCYRLCRAMLSILKENPKHFKRYTHIVMPSLTMFAKFTEPYGVKVDREQLEGLKAQLVAAELAMQNSLLRNAPPDVKLDAIRGGYASLGSPRFIREILFSKRGFNLKPTVFTKAGNEPSTSTSEHLVYFEHVSWVQDYIEYVKLKKLNSTYVSDFDKYIAEDGCIHPSFLLHRTNTGRVASADPNGQNFPKRGALAMQYRRMFVARDGYTIVEADYSQVELKLAAIMSGDANMLAAYREHGDLHIKTAADTMHLSVEEFKRLDKAIQKQKRFEAKAINFGFIYGMSADGFRVYAKTQYKIDYTIEEAEAFRNTFFKSYPGLLVWHDRVRRFANQNGYVVSPHGVIRHLPSIYSKDRATKSMTERQAINAPVQLLGSDLTLMAATRFTRDADPDKARVILMVHDAVVMEVRKDVVEEYASALKWYMENNPVTEWFDFTPEITLNAEVAIGDSYGDTDEDAGASIQSIAPSWYNRERDLEPPMRHLASI